MKKLYYFLLLALPMFFVTSCDDDNDLPNVDISLAISGGVEVDNAVYVVACDTLSIDAIEVTNLEKDKSAIITEAAYSWDYGPVFYSVNPPYGASFLTSEALVGTHFIQIQCPLYAVDKSPAMIHMSCKVVVVSSADDIPAGTQDTVFTVKPSVKEN